MKQSNQMNDQELKLRESQHQEKENNATILRSIYDKVTQTPWWAKAVMMLLLLNLCVVSAVPLTEKQITGLTVQAAEHLAIISEQKQHIDTLRQHKEECDEREFSQLKKIRQFAESDMVFKGMLFDEPNYYIAAQTRNEYRRQGHYGDPHKFTFSRWHVALRAKIIDQCIADNKVNSLRWFAEQDGWQLICEKRQLAAALVLAKETETASNKSQNRS